MMGRKLVETFKQIRLRTEEICAPLEIEDFVVQPITDVSPPKWHLAHSSWFFEQFVLVKFAENYQEFDPDFSFLFNSYYNNMGERTLRQNRGFITRPTVAKVLDYRKYVTEAVLELLEKKPSNEIAKLVEIGIHHEQQHQELLVYDIKYILGTQPTSPSYGDFFKPKEEKQNQKWISIAEGLYKIGHGSDTFCFDNEIPLHKRFILDFEISNKLVTNREYIEFIEDGGYKNFNLWHDEGWHFIRNNKIKQPLYWHLKEGEWFYYTFNGLQKMNENLPLMHISMFEAFAFAEWKGMRLPTEFEWEAASKNFEWGELWEWTHSAYLPYPGFAKADGALGEYNGKFMMNQMVLRGASVATPKGHGRTTYRNFFPASSRWIFSGIRLAKNA